MKYAHGSILALLLSTASLTAQTAYFSIEGRGGVMGPGPQVSFRLNRSVTNSEALNVQTFSYAGGVYRQQFLPD
jgi:hypothetical protein